MATKLRRDRYMTVDLKVPDCLNHFFFARTDWTVHFSLSTSESQQRRHRLPRNGEVTRQWMCVVCQWRADHSAGCFPDSAVQRRSAGPLDSEPSQFSRVTITHQPTLLVELISVLTNILFRVATVTVYTHQ